MADEGTAYAEVLADAQRLGYADRSSRRCGRWRRRRQDRHPLGLAYGGPIERAAIPTEGIDRLDGSDVTYAEQRYVVKLVAQAKNLGTASDGTVQLDVRVARPCCRRITPSPGSMA